MNRKTNQVRLGLETLEDRCVPAVAAVNLVGADLVITTDESNDTYTLNLTADNTIEVSDGGGSEGSFSGVTGNVIFTGGAAAENVAVNLNGFNLDASLDFDLLGDDDSVSINGDDGALNGQVNISLGEGENSLEMEEVRLVQNFLHYTTGQDEIDIADATLEGSASFNLNDEAASIDLDMRSTKLASFLSVVGGDNDDRVYLKDVVVHQNLGVNLGGGSDRLELSGSEVLGTLKHVGDGQQRVTLGGSQVTGFVSLNHLRQAEEVSMTVTVSNTLIGGFLSVLGTSGQDSITLTNSAVGDNVGMGLEEGKDTLTLNLAKVGGSLVHRGLGRQDVTINLSAIAGFTSINGQETASEVRANLTTSTFGNYLSIVGGELDDRVQLSGLTVLGNLGIRTGTGNDQVDVGGFYGQNVRVNTGADNDAIKMFDGNFMGDVSILAGDGDNTLGIDASANTVDTTFLGTFNYEGGAGNDAVTLGNRRLVIFIDRVHFTQQATFEGGEGTNTINTTYAVFAEDPIINNFA